MSTLRLVGDEQVVDSLRGSRAVVSSPGCGAPSTLLRLLGDRCAEVPGLTLYSGMLLDGYPFLDAVESGLLRYGTWHVMPPIRSLVAEGKIGFFPMRASQVTGLLDSLETDTVMVRVSPPDRHGFCSLGPSVSYPRHAVRRSRLVIAEIDEAVPRTRGESEIHVSDIHVAIESRVPMPEYRRAPIDETSRAIARHLTELLPDRPTLQIGIGAIPEAFLDQLVADDIGGLRFAGMAVDGMADLFEAGLLDHGRTTPYPAVMAAELMGSRRLMDFADDNAALGVYSTEYGITASSLWDMDRFVTINSALQVDRFGQVNAESLRGVQISGVGGSVDFTESAIHSDGGLRVIAMTSTDVRSASSKIVRSFDPLSPVTVPRHSVDYVVTEFGAARLGYASVQDRVEALAGIAHPDHREEILRKAGQVEPDPVAS